MNLQENKEYISIEVVDNIFEKLPENFFESKEEKRFVYEIFLKFLNKSKRLKREQSTIHWIFTYAKRIRRSLIQDHFKFLNPKIK